LTISQKKRGLSVIEKLTPKQEKGITEWREHCLKIGRDTSPINKPLTEQSWKKFYKILGKKEPFFWYCQSPLQAQIILNIFPEIVRIFKITGKGANIEANIRANIWDSIWANIGTNIGDNIRANIRDSIWANIGTNIRDNIRTNIWANIRDSIEDNIRDNIGTNIRDSIRKMKLEYIDTYSWCQHDINWIAYYKYFEKYGLLPYDRNFEIFDIWYDLACSCGWCYTFENMVFVCEKPSKLYLNNQGRLHNPSGMALEYSDGYGLWMLNGVRVGKELIITPAEKLNPQLVVKEKNAEIRRELVRKIGIERVCQHLNAKCIDKKGGYELLLLDLGDNRKRPYLKMRNPSIGTYHIEGVEPQIRTVEDALVWRNGTKEKPVILT